ASAASALLGRRLRLAAFPTGASFRSLFSGRLNLRLGVENVDRARVFPPEDHGDRPPVRQDAKQDRPTRHVAHIGIGCAMLKGVLDLRLRQPSILNDVEVVLIPMKTDMHRPALSV